MLVYTKIAPSFYRYDINIQNPERPVIFFIPTIHEYESSSQNYGIPLNIISSKDKIFWVLFPAFLVFEL